MPLHSQSGRQAALLNREISGRERCTRFGPGKIMVRTMLFAFASLIGVGTLVAMEAGTPPRGVLRTNEPPALSTVGIGASHDTLTKADRLGMTYVRNDVPIEPAPSELVPTAESISVSRPPASKAISLPSHDPIARKLAVLLPRARPNNLAKNTANNPAKDTTKNISRSAITTTASVTKRVTNTDRAKLVLEPCQPNAFGSLLKVLNLPSGCQT
jgi:hypothetical protein